VIGFDADHCIVKYNVRALTEHILRGHFEDFIELGYPQSIKDFEMNDSYLEMLMNWSIFDIENGLIIRMVEGQEVTRAMRGRTILS
jgi:hypothetical protein